MFFKDSLLRYDWKKALEDGLELDCMVPEYAIAVKDAKEQRILNGDTVYYSLIIPLLKPKSKIMDACSGSGYGSCILSACGHEVTAVESNKSAVEISKHRDIDHVIKGNIITETFGEFDAIVCVDAFEHFKLRDQKTLIKNFHSQLKDRGLLYIVTPCPRESHGYKNSTHKWEISWEDMRSIMFSEAKWTSMRHFFIGEYRDLYKIPTECSDCEHVPEKIRRANLCSRDHPEQAILAIK